MNNGWIYAIMSWWFPPPPAAAAARSVASRKAYGIERRNAYKSNGRFGAAGVGVFLHRSAAGLAPALFDLPNREREG